MKNRKLKIKIKKGDMVKILRGKDRGRNGKIEKVLPEKRKIIVEGANLYKKHVKPQGERKKGGIIEVTKPIPIANVMLICPKCSKTTRVGWQFQGKGKIRICKKCGVSI